MDEQES